MASRLGSGPSVSRVPGPSRGPFSRARDTRGSCPDGIRERRIVWPLNRSQRDTTGKRTASRTTHFSCNNVVRGPHDSCAPHIFYRKTRHCLLRSNDDVHRTRKTLKISGRFGDGGTEMIVIFVFKSVSIRPPTTCIAFFIILFFRHRNGRDPRNVPRPTSVSLFFPCNSLDEHPLPDVRVRRYARTVGRFTSSDG